MFGILRQRANENWEYRLRGWKAEGGDFSNVSKNIVKQGLEGCLGYCANVPTTIEKTDYEEGGVATCENH